MLLQEISDHSEPVGELHVLIKTFPNTWQKMVEGLRNKPGKLKFAGYDIYDASGFGPAIDGLTHHVKESMNNGSLQLSVYIDTGKQGFDEMLDVKEGNHVWTGYDPVHNTVLLGYDAWVSEDDYSAHFDERFQEVYGEEFDYDIDEHREIYDAAVRKFNENGFYGLLLVCEYSDGYKPMFDVDREAGKGFFKGIAPMIQHSGYIDL